METKKELIDLNTYTKNWLSGTENQESCASFTRAAQIGSQPQVVVNFCKKLDSETLNTPKLVFDVMCYVAKINNRKNAWAQSWATSFIVAGSMPNTALYWPGAKPYKKCIDERLQKHQQFLAHAEATSAALRTQYGLYLGITENSCWKSIVAHQLRAYNSNINEVLGWLDPLLQHASAAITQKYQT